MNPKDHTHCFNKSVIATIYMCMYIYMCTVLSRGKITINSKAEKITYGQLKKKFLSKKLM